MTHIGLLGYGTVGQGVVKILLQEPTLLKKVHVEKILVRNLAKARKVEPPKGTMTTDFEEILKDSSISVIVELTGAVEEAFDYLKRAMEQGIHVVTANKAVVSKYFEELSAIAQKQGVYFLYEASVAAAIPVIKSLVDQVRINEITEIRGIMNGTSNYILTKMLQGEKYEDVLEEAQALGYAEADPSADVKGWDVQRKLRILSTLAFRGSVYEKNIFTQGIDKITDRDIHLLLERGKIVKLVAYAKKEENCVFARVGPVALYKDDLLASIGSEDNIVEIQGSHVGKLKFIGPGAGMEETANAVISDVLDILEENRPKDNPLGDEEFWHVDDYLAQYYIRSKEEVNLPVYAKLGENIIITEPVTKKQIMTLTTEEDVVIEYQERYHEVL